MMSDVCWWVMPSDGWCWVKRTVMGRQRSEKPLPQYGRRGSESGNCTVVFSNCRVGLLSFCHDWTSSCWLCIHYGGRLSRRSSEVHDRCGMAYNVAVSVLEGKGKGTLLFYGEILFCFSLCPFSYSVCLCYLKWVGQVCLKTWDISALFSSG